MLWTKAIIIVALLASVAFVFALSIYLLLRFARR